MSSWLIICLALSALLAVNALVAVASAAFWLALRQRARTWPVADRARFLFALRIFPLFGALTVVLILFIPSYLTYEPRPADEVVNLKIAVMAALATFGLALTVCRALASWRATRRLVDDWLDRAEEVVIDGLGMPAFRFTHPFPVLAVVGVFRPRLFIADGVIEALDEHELAAALAHEAAHLTARDHLKLVLLRACCDFFALVPGSRALERAWAAEAEAAADEQAARAGTAAALNLAAALIKIARLTPDLNAPILPVGAYLAGDDVGSIERRVRRLIEMAGSETDFNQSAFASFSVVRRTWVACLGGIFLTTVLIAITPRLLLTTHSLTEHFFLILR
jgi:Zn-dependent protease with chaperone function